MGKKVKLSFSHSMHCALSHCHFWLFAAPWTAACQAPLSMEILQARILEWLPYPPPGDLPNPGIEPRSLTLQADSFTDSHQGSPRILEWVAYPFSRGSSWPRNCTGVSCIVEKAMATHSSTLAWKIPWTEEPGRLQSMGSQRIRHDWAISLSGIGEGNGNPLLYSCLENPRNGGAWWAAVYGVTQSLTRLKWLSSSSSSTCIASGFFTSWVTREYT